MERYVFRYSRVLVLALALTLGIVVTAFSYQLTKEVVVNEVVTTEGLVVDREVVERYVLSSSKYEVVEIPGLCERCVISPNSTFVVEKEVERPIPLPLILLPVIKVYGGTLEGDYINGTDGTVVELRVRVFNLLSVPVVLAISAQYPDNVIVTTDRRESYAHKVGSQKISYWNYVVENDTSITVRYLVKSTGSWHVVRLPPLSIMYSANFDELERSYRERINKTGELSEEAVKFTKMITTFRKTIGYFRENMTEFSGLLNSTAQELLISANAINASSALVKSLNRQLNALASSLELLALTANTTRLLVDYEYTFLKTLATALRVQSSALYAYVDIMRSVVRDLELLDEVLANVEEVLRGLASRPLPSNVSEVAKSLERSIRATRETLGDIVDALYDTMSDVRALARRMDEVSRSTERNATLLVERSPFILASISGNLTEASAYLTNATKTVGKSLEVIEEIAETLTKSSTWLANTSRVVLRLTHYLEAQEYNLTLIESYLMGQAEKLNVTISRMQEELRRVNSFKKVVNANSIRVNLAIRLPSLVDRSVLNKLELKLNKSDGLTPRGRQVKAAPIPAAIVALAAIAVFYYVYRLRRHRATSPKQ